MEEGQAKLVKKGKTDNKPNLARTPPSRLPPTTLGGLTFSPSRRSQRTREPIRRLRGFEVDNGRLEGSWRRESGQSQQFLDSNYVRQAVGLPIVDVEVNVQVQQEAAVVLVTAEGEGGNGNRDGEVDGGGGEEREGDGLEADDVQQMEDEDQQGDAPSQQPLPPVADLLNLPTLEEVIPTNKLALEDLVAKTAAKTKFELMKRMSEHLEYRTMQAQQKEREEDRGVAFKVPHAKIDADMEHSTLGARPVVAMPKAQAKIFEAEVAEEPAGTAVNEESKGAPAPEEPGVKETAPEPVPDFVLTLNVKELLASKKKDLRELLEATEAAVETTVVEEIANGETNAVTPAQPPEPTNEEDGTWTMVAGKRRRKEEKDRKKAKKDRKEEKGISDKDSPPKKKAAPKKQTAITDSFKPMAKVVNLKLGTSDNLFDSMMEDDNKPASGKKSFDSVKQEKKRPVREGKGRQRIPYPEYVRIQESKEWNAFLEILRKGGLQFNKEGKIVKAGVKFEKEKMTKTERKLINFLMEEATGLKNTGAHLATENIAGLNNIAASKKEEKTESEENVNKKEKEEEKEPVNIQPEDQQPRQHGWTGTLPGGKIGTLKGGDPKDKKDNSGEKVGKEQKSDEGKQKSRMRGWLSSLPGIFNNVLGKFLRKKSGTSSSQKEQLRHIDEQQDGAVSPQEPRPRVEVAAEMATILDDLKLGLDISDSDPEEEVIPKEQLRHIDEHQDGAVSPQEPRPRVEVLDEHELGLDIPDSDPEEEVIPLDQFFKKPTQGETRKEMEREEFVRRDEENHKKQDSDIREINEESENTLLKKDHEEQTKSLSHRQFKEENRAMRRKLEVIPVERLRTCFRDNIKYFDDVMRGKQKVSASHKHTAFRNGKLQQGLLYQQHFENIFTADQIEAIIEEATAKWMPTITLFNKNTEYVSSVIYPTFLEKIYMEVNKVYRPEALDRISKTPGRTNSDSEDEETEKEADGESSTSKTGCSETAPLTKDGGIPECFYCFRSSTQKCGNACLTFICFIHQLYLVAKEATEKSSHPLLIRCWECHKSPPSNLKVPEWKTPLFKSSIILNPEHDPFIKSVSGFHPLLSEHPGSEWAKADTPETAKVEAQEFLNQRSGPSVESGVPTKTTTSKTRQQKTKPTGAKQKTTKAIVQEEAPVPLTGMELVKMRKQNHQARRPLLMLENRSLKRCGLNAAANAIMTPRLRIFFQGVPDDSHPLIKELKRFSQDQQELKQGESVKELILSLVSVKPEAKRFLNKVLQDSQEFLSDMMEGISTVLFGDLLREWTDLTSLLFEERTECNNCREISSNIVKSNCLELLVVDGEEKRLKTLDECLRQKMSDDIIGQDWTCDKCKAKDGAIKRFSIKKHPKILFVMLKRWRWRSNRQFKENQAINNEDGLCFTIAGQVYNIVGVVNHHGNTNSNGHFTFTSISAYAAFLCDDNNVPELRKEEQVRKDIREAYVLVLEAAAPTTATRTPTTSTPTTMPESESVLRERPHNIPLLNLKDSRGGMISSTLNSILSTQVGGFLARQEKPISSRFLSRLQELALGNPETTWSWELDEISYLIRKESNSFDQQNGLPDLQAFVTHLILLLGQLKRDLFHFQSTLLCRDCGFVQGPTKQVAKPLLLNLLSKEEETDIGEEVKLYLTKHDKGIVVPLKCPKPRCGGDQATERSKVSNLPSVLIVIVKKRKEKQITKVGSIHVQGRVYKISSVISNNGNFYSDHVVHLSDSEASFWRCDQQDARGPQEIDKDEFDLSLTVGEVFFFEEEIENRSEPQLKEPAPRRSFGPSLSQDFPSSLPKTPETATRPKPQPRNSRNSSFLGTIDRDLQTPPSAPRKQQLLSKKMLSSPLAKDIEGPEGEKRLKERQETRCFKCWREPTLLEKNGKLERCYFCGNLLCHCHVQFCFFNSDQDHPTFTLYEKKTLCHPCLTSKPEWSWSFKNRNGRMNPVLSEDGSFIPAPGLKDYLEDNGQNQLPDSMPNIGKCHNVIGSIDEVKDIASLYFGPEEEEQDLSSISLEDIEDMNEDVQVVSSRQSRVKETDSKTDIVQGTPRSEETEDISVVQETNSDQGDEVPETATECGPDHDDSFHLIQKARFCDKTLRPKPSATHLRVRKEKEKEKPSCDVSVEEEADMFASTSPEDVGDEEEYGNTSEDEQDNQNEAGKGDDQPREELDDYPQNDRPHDEIELDVYTLKVRINIYISIDDFSLKEQFMDFLRNIVIYDWIPEAERDDIQFR